ncbi:glutathione S-transferase [Tamilnaduibacter salinus]|uniref:glutathione transferase n=1 Tax=Tamilnaduibacter salinus TaxID=1484056 RepID=A0A2U1CVK6_9GAMM|nr:glutathione S-transferase [Tamilnaduibacter salinus]PVY75776.1 glutathione S-transferase [Tamilnaduibacter salinus]
MITVHHLNNSRSQRVLWMLEELGEAYEIQRYERNPETMLAPESLKAVHPLGKSPVLTDGELTIAESGAILEYLADTYGDGMMRPGDEPQERIDYRYWMHYAEGSLMPPLVMRLVFEKIKNSPMPFFAKPIARQIADKTQSTFLAPQIQRHLDFIEAHLKERSWFVGDRLTAADVQMSFPLEASVARGTVGNRPAIRDYVARYQARPAYQRALEAGGEYAFA